jgi:hypothetical protein
MLDLDSDRSHVYSLATFTPIDYEDFSDVEVTNESGEEWNLVIRRLAYIDLMEVNWRFEVVFQSKNKFACEQHLRSIFLERPDGHHIYSIVQFSPLKTSDIPVLSEGIEDKFEEEFTEARRVRMRMEVGKDPKSASGTAGTGGYYSSSSRSSSSTRRSSFRNTSDHTGDGINSVDGGPPSEAADDDG